MLFHILSSFDPTTTFSPACPTPLKSCLLGRSLTDAPRTMAVSFQARHVFITTSLDITHPILPASLLFSPSHPFHDRSQVMLHTIATQERTFLPDDSPHCKYSELLHTLVCSQCPIAISAIRVFSLHVSLDPHFGGLQSLDTRSCVHLCV